MTAHIESRPLSSDWVISLRDPFVLWNEHWFGLLLEVVSAALLLLLLSKRHGSDSRFVLVAAAITPVIFELLPLIPRPGYQLWWYHPGVINIARGRVPSYLFTTFALIHYVVHKLAHVTNLPSLTRALVSGVAGILLYYPCLYLGQKLLLVTIHFDDPIYSCQLGGVPYIQILISFLMFFHTSYHFTQNTDALAPQDRNSYGYSWCAVQAGVAAGSYTIVEQYLIYLGFNLILNLHTAFCVIATLAFLFYLAKQELQATQITFRSVTGATGPLMRKEFWAFALVLLSLSTVPLYLNTEELRSTGSRMELGECGIMHNVSNSSPLYVSRRQFICPEDAVDLPYDFHCANPAEIKLGVESNSTEYTICGKPFDKPLQLFKMLLSYSVICLVMVYGVLRVSYDCKIQENGQNLKKVE